MKLQKIRKKIAKKYNKFEKFFLPKLFPLIVKDKFTRFPSSLNGHYNLSTSDSFYKIVTKNRKFFEEEKKLIIFIKNNHPEIGKIIPEYKYKKYLFGLILVRKTKILIPIEDEEESYETAKSFLVIFRNYSCRESVNLDQLFYLKKGLDILKSLVLEDVYKKIEKLVIDFLENEIFSIGFCHGDFHSKNLMKDQKNKYLIDLDCIRKNSLQEFDAIYFIIQRITDDNIGIWWHEATRIFKDKVFQNKKYQDFLINFLDLNKLPTFILLYFLDRVGQDAKYMEINDKIPETEIINTIKSIL